MQLTANLVSPFAPAPTPATLTIHDGRIASIAPATQKPSTFLLPGFIDAHVHIESSMLIPSEFARLAVLQGTVATVSDPHEIANVLGLEGVRFMVQNAAQVPFHILFGAPACVPATPFETSGASLSAANIAELFDSGDCHYLSEVMNFPGVLAGDSDLLAKLAAARSRAKPIDGHAPALRGKDAENYFAPALGITTDHECTSLDEALEKISRGVRILIREGSAAKNFHALLPLLTSHPHQVMLCSDDKHPDDLLAGHINLLVTRALAAGVPLANALRAACINPMQHYHLPVGLLRVGDSADFIETDSLEDFSSPHILRTFIKGQLVADRGISLIPPVPSHAPNRFAARPVTPEDFAVPVAGSRLRVIVAHDGQLLTTETSEAPTVKDNLAIADPTRDLLKIAVLNRYQNAPQKPAVAFIRGFDIRRGAIASSVAHDSHNIVAIGADDASLAAAVNAVIAARGALALTDGLHEHILPLPVAGLMSNQPAQSIAAQYSALQDLATTHLGSTLKAPFMTLSFMALLVIPALKLSDKGLFNTPTFSFTNLFESL